MDHHLHESLKTLSRAMFHKGFFGIYHGSLSAKIANNRFLINTKDAIFDSLSEKDLIELTHIQDYRWHQASMDALIHQQIYSHISEAKYVAYVMPPYTVAYALKNNKIIPQDYFASQILGDIEVYDPKSFDDWYERASSEIFIQFQKTGKSLMVIRGYGVYAFDRDILQMAKKIAVLENSCRLLLLASREANEQLLQSVDSFTI